MKIVFEHNDITQRLLIDGVCYAEESVLLARDVLSALASAGVIGFEDKRAEYEE